MSDSDCRAVTGDEIAMRRLYTDGDQYVATVQCGIVMTSIDPSGDLAERMLTIQLESLRGRVIPEHDLVADVGARKASLLGAIFDQFRAVLRNLPHTVAPVDGWPHLADCGRVLAALDIENGTESLPHYSQAVHDTAVDSVTTDLLVAAVMGLVCQDDPVVRTTASALFKELRLDDALRADSERYWKKPELMSGRIKRAIPGMRQAGVEVTVDRDSKAATSRSDASTDTGRCEGGSAGSPAGSALAVRDRRSSKQPERPGAPTGCRA